MAMGKRKVSRSTSCGLRLSQPLSTTTAGWRMFSGRPASQADPSTTKLMTAGAATRKISLLLRQLLMRPGFPGR